MPMTRLRICLDQSAAVQSSNTPPIGYNQGMVYFPLFLCAWLIWLAGPIGTFYATRRLKTPLRILLVVAVAMVWKQAIGMVMMQLLRDH